MFQEYAKIAQVISDVLTLFKGIGNLPRVPKNGSNPGGPCPHRASPKGCPG